MQQIQIALKKKQLDGAITPVEVKLGTIKPLVVTAVHFSTAARLVLCQTKTLQQQLIATRYQMTGLAPVGVLLHVASNVIWKHFLLDITPADSQRIWFRHPQVWAPVTIQSDVGSLHAMVEARSGSLKHKSTIEIVLDVYEKQR